MSVFFVWSTSKEKRKKRFKNKVTKHVERIFFKKFREKGNGQRKGNFFGGNKTEKRYFPFL